MPGPKPTPTATLKKRGSWRGKKRTKEPQAEVGLPDVPSWLDERALAHWNELGPKLVAMGVLTTIDGNVLANYCEATGKIEDAALQINADGMVLTDTTGNAKPNPAVSMQLKYMAAAARFGAMLGLSPADRTRVHATPVADGGEVKLSIQDFAEGRAG